MKVWLQRLASLKLAVVLLVLLLLGLSVGTIIESKQGVEVAGKLVYFAWWFLALQAVFAVNVIASIVTLFPWGKERIGYLMTHGSMVLILVGALVTFFFKTEGHLGLWEGQSSNVVDLAEAKDGKTTFELPFTVKLNDFQIDHYPGTMRPAMFRSLVEITDPASGQTFAARIWMNNELTFKGYTLFQSSYQQTDGREASILSVSKDPGQPIVFVGYFLLVIGMCVVMGTRIASRRRIERELAARSASRVTSTAAVALLALGSLLGPARAAAADADWVDTLRRLPVQHDGRAMPLDTLAREGVIHVTGGRSLDGADPVATVAEWMFDPQRSAQAPIVPVTGELAAAIGLPRGTSRASFAQIVNSQPALQLMQQARQLGMQEQRRTGVVADAEKLEDRLLWLQSFFNRERLAVVPVAGNPVAKWGPAQTPNGIPDLLAMVNGQRLEGWPTEGEIAREIRYNAFNPYRVAWLVLLAALVVSIVAWNRRNKVLDGVAFGGLAVGFAVMTWAVVTRWQVAGRIPASNMFESLLFLAWGVGLFAVIAFAFMRNRLVVLNANAMAALTMALMDLLPIDRFIHPMPPVLSGTPWLAIHVPIIMVSYSVLALGVVIAHMQIGFSIFSPKRLDLVEKMSDLLYWYMIVGSILLIAGILTGSLWAAESWGRYWGWDPKEVWSLVAWLAYIAIIHARWDRLIGPFGIAAWSIAAFQTILMTYLGVNYVLGTGLHSYGFGDSPIATWMLIIAAVEAAFVTWGWMAHRKLGPQPQRAL